MRLRQRHVTQTRRQQATERTLYVSLCASLCVCVCLYDRERERERESRNKRASDQANRQLNRNETYRLPKNDTLVTITQNVYIIQ